MNSKQRFRARLIFFLIIAGGAVLGSSLYWRQIVNGESYAAKADKQYDRPASSLFDRGSIFFSSKDGTKPAAASVQSGYILYANPKLLTAPAQAYEAISQYIKLDKAEFMRKAGKSSDTYEELAHRLPEDTAKSIQNLLITGIGIAKENWRSYPGNELAAQTLGIIGENSEKKEVEGKYGLESFYENTLKRSSVNSGASVYAGIFSGVFGTDASGGDVVTTIEPSVQKFLEKTLKDISDTWHSDEIGGIIMDPNTGEIVAMGSWPTFDPNKTSAVKNVSVFSNPLVEHAYEMGSIMKPLTMAIGLDSGSFTPNSTYNDIGTMVLNTKKISNFDGKARGVVPMQEVLSQSLNVGAATIALKVGKEKFSSYFDKFGIGKKPGIDQPNESAGLVSNLKNGKDIELATAAYGQGIAVSPVAMARALSVLANGGFLVKPHLASEIDLSNGTTQKIAGERTGPVIKKQTADEVTRMLVKVVDTALKKGAIKMDHYSIAAKTGTAQIADPAHGNYFKDKYLHSFFGYFPAYDPKFLVFLYHVYPKGAEYASETLTDPFSEIAKFLINYYNVPPDR